MSARRKRIHWQKVEQRHLQEQAEFDAIERDTLEWQIRRPIDTTAEDAYDFVLAEEHPPPRPPAPCTIS
jgi:hypothetical protein